MFSCERRPYARRGRRPWALHAKSATVKAAPACATTPRPRVRSHVAGAIAPGTSDHARGSVSSRRFGQRPSWSSYPLTGELLIQRLLLSEQQQDLSAALAQLIKGGDRVGCLPAFSGAVETWAWHLSDRRPIVARRTRSAISSLLQVTRNRLISNAPQTRGSASAPCSELLAPEHRPPSTKRSAIPAAWSWSRTVRTSSTRQDSYVLSSDHELGILAAGFTDPGQV